MHEKNELLTIKNLIKFMQRKKDYLQPRTEVIALDLERPLAASGENETSLPGGDGPEEARSFQYDDWDDDY